MGDGYRAYPWHALPSRTAAEARLATALAHLAAVAEPPTWSHIRRLLRLEPSAPVRARLAPTLCAASAPRFDPHAVSAPRFDPHAAACDVHRDGAVLRVRGSSDGVRAIAQRLLGGPDELPAPRPLDDVETSLWCLTVATLLEDLAIAGHVWPAAPDAAVAGHVGPAAPDAATSGMSTAATERGTQTLGAELLLGDIRVAVAIDVPAELALRVAMDASERAACASAASRSQARAWLDRVELDLPIVAGRCALHRDDLARLRVRSVVTLDRPTSGAMWDLDLLGGTLGLSDRRTAGQGTHAVVVTGYGCRDMSLPDAAHVELTVTVGTTRMSLRQITELAVGQIVQLHRPLGGPFELRVDGRILGHAELVDVDGELAVRIVSLGD